MGQITTGVGLISGINTAQLIDQLLAIEARPKTLLQQRNTVLQSQQVAYQEINAKLLALKLDSAAFSDSKLFQATTANSSNPSLVTATTSASAAPGSYNFTVGRLVNTQQIITAGYADAAATPIGAGTLTFEFGDAKLSTDTRLSQLNGGQGVSRGKIRITDRSGASAVVDLSRALTVNDVLDAINTTSGINVTASVSGDGLQLVDNTGLTTAALSVVNLGVTNTATSLGLTAAAVGSTLSGSQINKLGTATQLSALNDGNGVRIKGVLDDLQITRRDGTTFSVVLDGSKTLGDVISKINAASGGNVTASLKSDGTGLQLVDATAGATAFAVTALNSSKAAADLGILASATGGGDTIGGDRLLAELNSRLVKNLRGGAGVSLGSISITNRAGVVTSPIDLSSAKSVSDILDAINQSGAQVTASINNAGTGILLSDQTGQTTSNLIVSGAAATDLGLAGSFAAASKDGGNLQFRYISEATRLSSLNGGAGVASGKIKITDSSGATATVDLSTGAAVTIADVLANINSRGLQINARINDHGDGILIEDTGPKTTALKVEESGSTTARDLGLLGSAASAGANLDGTFEKTITIGATDTLNNVADKINSAGLNVKASVLNDGSGVNPFRISLQATQPGKAGAFLFDDGGLGMGASTLVQAQDAVVFFGSADPAQAVPITSTTNTLTTVIPGATVNLLGVSSGPVTVNISRDDSAILTAVKKFATDFNSVIDTLNKYDTYNADTKQKGLLLGDSTVARVRTALFNQIINRNKDLTTQFTSLAQIGVTIGTGAHLSVNETKFNAALAQDRNAVQQLFTYKTTGKDAQGNSITTAAGIGVRIDEMLKGLTDSDTGAMAAQLDSVSKIIQLNQDRMDQIDAKLAAKKLVLQNQFNAMEKALAQLQQQSASLANFGVSVPTSTKTSSTSG